MRTCLPSGLTYQARQVSLWGLLRRGQPGRSSGRTQGSAGPQTAPPGAALGVALGFPGVTLDLSRTELFFVTCPRS